MGVAKLASVIFFNGNAKGEPHRKAVHKRALSLGVETLGLWKINDRPAKGTSVLVCRGVLHPSRLDDPHAAERGASCPSNCQTPKCQVTNGF